MSYTLLHRRITTREPSLVLVQSDQFQPNLSRLCTYTLGTDDKIYSFHGWIHRGNGDRELETVLTFLLNVNLRLNDKDAFRHCGLRNNCRSWFVRGNIYVP
jgi:hypothetical protein